MSAESNSGKSGPYDYLKGAFSNLGPGWRPQPPSIILFSLRDTLPQEANDMVDHFVDQGVIVLGPGFEPG